MENITKSQFVCRTPHDVPHGIGYSAYLPFILWFYGGAAIYLGSLNLLMLTKVLLERIVEPLTPASETKGRPWIRIWL